MVTLQIEADAAGTMMNDFLKSLSDEQKVEVATNFLEKAFQKEESWSRNMCIASGRARIQKSLTDTKFILDTANNDKIMAVLEPV